MKPPNRITILIAAAVMLFPLLAQMCAPTACANIDIYVRRFGNGSSEALIAFSSAGSDTSLNMSFQTGLRVQYAYLNLTGLPFTVGGTDCPESPALDLGNDGTVEWRFNGTGYGSLGHQYLFSDGNTSFCTAFGPAGGSNGSMAFRLPAGARISFASVTIAPSGFAGSLNVSYDVGNDSVDDWFNTALTGVATIAGFDSVLTAYLASAAPSGSDPFGVSYVDIPVSIRCGSAATLTFANLSLSYACTLTTRNLGIELDQLIPDEQGAGNVSIPLKMTSSSAGKVRLWDIRVRTQPPVHAPQLLNPQPPPDPSMDENSSLNFSVVPGDMYGNPYTLQWYLDTTPVPGANTSFLVYRTNYTSAGRHRIDVAAANDMSESFVTWWVTVRDVNRAPVVESYSPENPASVAENSMLVFNVSARDPDGDQVSFTWRVDGQQQNERSGTFRYQPKLLCAGPHDIDVTVKDAGGKSGFQAWCVTVVKTNIPPVMDSFSPSGDATIKEGDTLHFTVAASDANRDTIGYEWVVDGFHAADGPDFDFSPDFRSSGRKGVRAVVTDGEFTVHHSWNITVLDVNHPPMAVMDCPPEGGEFLETDEIALSAARSSDPDEDSLTLSWTYDGVPLGNGSRLAVALPHGPHLIRLVADDGRGGRDEATANVTVRSIKLNITAKASPADAVKGSKVRMTVRILGEGDGTARNLTLDFYVDGVPSGSRFIPRVEPGANLTEKFEWTSEPGTHEFMLVAGNNTLTLKVTVVEGTSRWVYPVALILGAVTVSVGGAAAYFAYLNWVEPKPRNRRARSKGQGSYFWWGESRSDALERIRLESAPYKDRPLKIQTTVPEGVTSEDLIKQQLSTKRRWLMREPEPPAATPADAAAAPAPETEGAPQTEAAFSSSTAEALPVAPAAQPPGAPEAAGREKEEPAHKKPRKRIKDIEDRILALERKGTDVASARRFLSLARSFWKGGNAAKAEQYFEKAETRLADLETAAQATGIPLCPKCGATVDPTWVVCPECEGKLE